MYLYKLAHLLLLVLPTRIHKLRKNNIGHPILKNNFWCNWWFVCIGLVHWFMVLFCIALYSYCSSNYCDSNSGRSFSILKVIAKTYPLRERETTIAMNGKVIESASKKKQRTDTTIISYFGCTNIIFVYTYI